jgi:hypothetical protein
MSLPGRKRIERSRGEEREAKTKKALHRMNEEFGTERPCVISAFWFVATMGLGTRFSFPDTFHG